MAVAGAGRAEVGEKVVARVASVESRTKWVNRLVIAAVLRRQSPSCTPPHTHPGNSKAMDGSHALCIERAERSGLICVALLLSACCVPGNYAASAHNLQE